MNVAEIPSTSKRLEPKENDQKKIQEKAKRELDAIIQSWNDNSEGIVCRTEDNDQSLQDIHASYPSGREEIEGSNCSSLHYFFENDTKQSTSSLNESQSVPKFSVASEVQNDDELQLVTELCQQAGEVLNSAENHSKMCSLGDRNLLVKRKSKDSKVVSTVGAVAESSSVEKPISADNKTNGTVQCINQDGDSTGRPDNSDQKKQHLCNLCGKHYKSSSHLTRHIKTAHNNQQVQLCNICNASFTRSESLIRHLKLHEQRDGTDKTSKEGPFKCPKCHKSYQQAYNVTRHLLSHNGVKPFKCTECNKSFTQYTGLSRHLVLHKGSRDFQCKECGKSFARLFVLNRHMLTHSDDKPYKCFVCSKSFIRASQLSNHMSSHQKKSSNSS